MLIIAHKTVMSFYPRANFNRGGGHIALPKMSVCPVCAISLIGFPFHDSQVYNHKFDLG